MNILCALALAIALHTEPAGKIIDAGCRSMSAASLAELYLRMLPEPFEKAREAVMMAFKLRREVWSLNEPVAAKSTK
jgi:hypothetical protein